MISRNRRFDYVLSGGSFFVILPSLPCRATMQVMQLRNCRRAYRKARGIPLPGGKLFKWASISTTNSRLSTGHSRKKSSKLLPGSPAACILIPARLYSSTIGAAFPATRKRSWPSTTVPCFTWPTGAAAAHVPLSPHLPRSQSNGRLLPTTHRPRLCLVFGPFMFHFGKMV